MPITGPSIWVHTRSIDPNAIESHDSLRGSMRMWRRKWIRDLSHFIVRAAFFSLLAMIIYSVKASAQSNDQAMLSSYSARPLQSLPLVRVAAEQLVREAATSDLAANDAKESEYKLFITASEPDPRLQLADCGDKLRAFTLNGARFSSRNTIGVRCADEKAGAWTLYLSVAIEIERPTLVLKHSLARDAHIGPDDVDIQVRRVPGFGSANPNSLAAVRDQHLKRGAPAGTIVTGELLTRDLLIKRGQEVSLVSDATGIAVRAPGLALSDGGLADRVRVQNRTSLKVVEGVVESGNLVRVGM